MTHYETQDPIYIFSFFHCTDLDRFYTQLLQQYKNAFFLETLLGTQTHNDNNPQ